MKKMETFDFFPFVTPTNTGMVVFPDNDTRVQAITVTVPTPVRSPDPTPSPVAAAADPVDELTQGIEEMKIKTPEVDIEKVKRSSKKAGKNSDVYSLAELKEVAKSIGIRFKGNISKKNVIDLILKENRVF